VHASLTHTNFISQQNINDLFSLISANRLTFCINASFLKFAHPTHTLLLDQLLASQGLSTPWSYLCFHDVLGLAPCRLVGRCQRFVETYTLHLQGCLSETMTSTRRQNPEEHHHPHRRENLTSHKVMFCKADQENIKVVNI
jgi:hypothetical protein